MISNAYCNEASIAIVIFKLLKQRNFVKKKWIISVNH